MLCAPRPAPSPWTSACRPHAETAVATAGLSQTPGFDFAERAVEHVDRGIELVLWDVQRGLDLQHVAEAAVQRRPEHHAKLLGATEVLYDRARSAFAEAVRWPPDALADVRYAVLSGITPALSPTARAASRAMVREARSQGISVCLDVNYRSRLWSAPTARAELAPLLAGADIVVCSAEDAGHVLEVDPRDPTVLLDRWSPEASICVLTQGERGAIAWAHDVGVVSVAALPTVTVDRLGLGDAFLAGLLFGLLEGQALQSALAAGIALAALKAPVSGDFSLARRADLTAVLAQDAPVTVRR